MIAPFLANSQGIIQAWSHVAELVIEKKEFYQAILDGIEKIKWARVSPFDKTVAELVTEGKSNQNIASQLKVSVQEIRESSDRLKRAGFRSNRRTGRPISS